MAIFMPLRGLGDDARRVLAGVFDTRVVTTFPAV